MTLSWVPRLTNTALGVVTPTITAGAYTTGLQLGGIQAITPIVRQDSNSNAGYGIRMGTATLTEIVVLDKAKQSAAMDIWFFAASPTLVSADAQTFDISDANLVVATNGYPITLGFASVATYSTSNSNAISTDTNKNKTIATTIGSTIYAVPIIRASVTYASTSDLVFQYFFIVD